MKTKSVTLFAILLVGLFFSTNAFCQHTGGLPDLFDDFGKLQMIEGQTEEQYEGSPYITNDHSDHSLKYDTQEVINLHLRYNIHLDILEIEKDGQFYQINKDILITNFTIGDYNFLLKNKFKNKKLKKCYLEELSLTNNISLYKKHQITLIKAQSPKPYQEAKLARYAPAKPIYFLSIKNNSLASFTSEKQLLELFPNLKSEIKTYIKKDKLKYKEETDLIKIVAYTDTLLD